MQLGHLSSMNNFTCPLWMMQRAWLPVSRKSSHAPDGLFWLKSHDESCFRPSSSRSLCHTMGESPHEHVLSALKTFLLNGGSNIIFTCTDRQADVLSTKEAAAFGWKLLQILRCAPCRFLLVSRATNTMAAMIRGSALTLTKEQPSFQFSHLEIASDTEPFPLQAFDDFFSEKGQQQFRWQDDRLLKQQWSPLAETRDVSCPVQGNVLITGGNGALGQALATLLAKSSGCRVFLTGRRAFDASLEKQLKATGAKAWLQADCTDARAMQDICHYIQDNHGRIAAIFHLAGTLNDGLFKSKSLETYLKTVAPKVEGASVIEKLASEFQIGHVVLFSSLSAIHGNPGQTDYAAGNAYLNAVAERNIKKSACQWHAVNWGLWQTEHGMQMEPHPDMQPMPPQKAFAALCQVMSGPSCVSAIYQGSETLLAVRASPSAGRETSETVEAWVRDIVVHCTHLHDLENDDYLLERGVDSVIAINIVSGINRFLEEKGSHQRVPKTLIFQHGTVREIAGFLLANHFLTLPDAPSSHAIPENVPDDFRLEDIAIIGMAGEFPGAEDILAFWDLLKRGECAITEIPASRWDWRQHFSPDTSKRGISYARHGGFIRDAALFDAVFFKIAPAVARKMDPQIRRLLHQSCLALADAGDRAHKDQEVGVFTAAMYGHYQNLDSDEGLIDSSLAAMANQIAWYFDFKGPTLSVDTMCSGSLTALHLAVNSLRLGECSMALVGGVNIMSHPGKYRFLSEGKFLSPTGRCHSFGIAADGYVPGEGTVVLVLKPLGKARTEGNKIYGVIRGSAVNAGGHGSGFTVPSATAQAEVIRKALKAADLAPDSISCLEAHGTGTRLGDPIEAEGLRQVFGKSGTPCALGTVKSNIGHLESAAGLAGVVKVLLQMHYRTLVPTLFCDIENPDLLLHQSRLVLQKTLASWKGNEKKSLFAGISAFGAGGSNAHVILQSPPAACQRDHLSLPSVVFDPVFCWDDTLRFDQSLPRPATIPADTLLLKPSLKPAVSPLHPTEEPCVYVCLPAQMALLEKQLQGTRHHCLCLAIDTDWRRTLSHLTSTPHRTIINLCAIASGQQVGDYSRLQFDLAKQLVRSPFPLTYIHCVSAKDITTEDCHIKAHAALFRTMALEKPEIRMLLLETDCPFPTLLKTVSGTLVKEGASHHYHYDKGQWFLRHLEACSPLKHPAPLLKNEGIYLIAGGLGDVGYLMAEWLLREYHATVILLGRSAPAGRRQSRLETLQALASHKVDYHCVDITDASSVERGIARILESFGRLDGVIQSSAVLKDGMLAEKTYEDFDSVIRPKVAGTLHLDHATRHIPLDFFVMFSSVSSVFGNTGQSDYSVGNLFLDLFSRQRSEQVRTGSRSGKTLSINWPMWQVEGLALDAATIEFICDATGIRPLQSKEGVALFEHMMAQESPAQIIPLVGNPETIQRQLISPQPLAHMSALSDRNGVFEDSLTNMIKDIAGLSATHAIDEATLGDLGFNSILLSELATRIEKEHGIIVAPSAFFTYNDVPKIASYLALRRSSADSRSTTSGTTLSFSSQTMTPADNAFAIIGMDALLPGGPDIETFWQSLVDNRSAVQRISRWSKGEYHAATLPDIDCFDARFFGISNREAMLMDPQHRLFLQVAYNTLANAGYTPRQLSEVAVFVGVQFNDYQGLLQQQSLADHPYAATGNAHAMLANRISSLFDFTGPSQTIDTACSSTLVAINRGLIALQNHECKAVLAGAVSLLIDPAVTDAAHSMAVLSPRFRCATFDAEADGYVRGEGVGCFLIKRLADAQRDGDAIHAIIRGFAENHGGKANSLTAPNPFAQKQLLLKAYDSSLAQKVSYIETHGTGTKLGDPIELDALTQAFAVLHPEAPAGSIRLGAVKTNVGHLEPAAGIPSLVKVIMAFRHALLPANIHFSELNPYIQLANSPFSLVTENTPWTSDHPRVAGVSSFGFGGSNAHIVLESPGESRIPSGSQEKQIVTLSARSAESLRRMRETLASFLEKNSCPLERLAFTLNTGREAFEYRFAVLCEDQAALIKTLRNSEFHFVKVTPRRDPLDLTGMGHEDILQAWLAGGIPDWKTLYSKTLPARIHLPGYSFESSKHWFETATLEEACP